MLRKQVIRTCTRKRYWTDSWTFRASVLKSIMSELHAAQCSSQTTERTWASRTPPSYLHEMILIHNAAAEGKANIDQTGPRKHHAMRSHLPSFRPFVRVGYSSFTQRYPQIVRNHNHRTQYHSICHFTHYRQQRHCQVGFPIIVPPCPQGPLYMTPVPFCCIVKVLLLACPYGHLASTGSPFQPTMLVHRPGPGWPMGSHSQSWHPWGSE